MPLRDAPPPNRGVGPKEPQEPIEKKSTLNLRHAKENRPMTQLLEKALTEVRKLPETEQDAIASLILDELADEQLWQEKFARSQDQLACFASKVREDIRAGRVKSGGFDQL